MARKTHLTYEEWQALSDAEAPYYAGDPGAHAFTDVNERNDVGGLAVELWSYAEENVENAPYDDDGSELDALEQREEIARRVAHSLATVAFGRAFAAAGSDEDRERLRRMRAAGWEIADDGDPYRAS